MMRLILAISIAYLPGNSASAQQQNAADAFTSGYERGRQIREEREARERARQERIEAEDRRQREREAETIRREVLLARNNPSIIFKSKNDLPDIVLSEQESRACKPPMKIAFTRDASGTEIMGCALLDKGRLSVDWVGYGIRSYDPSAWEMRDPPSADQAPLGQ